MQDRWEETAYQLKIRDRFFAVWYIGYGKVVANRALTNLIWKSN